MDEKILRVELHGDRNMFQDKWRTFASNIGEDITRALLKLEKIDDDVKELMINVVFIDEDHPSCVDPSILKNINMV